MLVQYRFIAVALVAQFIVGCSSDYAVPIVTNPGRPECPDHQFVPRDKSGNLLPPVVIPLVDAGTNIPEFNDCQALVVGNNYGPTVAVFARQDPLPAAPIPTRWYLLAVVFNFGSLGTPGVAYGPLSINAEYSCLYAPVVGPITRAYLRSNGINPNCAEGIDPPTTGTLLEARIRPKMNPNDAVPRAARWEWDPANREQYIGVACRFEWCEIGRIGFQSAPSEDLTWMQTAPTVPGLVQSAAHRVRGYFDEQELAIANPSGGANDPLRPSGARAAFFPAPNLGTVPDFSQPRYVGTMTVRTTHPVYQAKFGLIAGTPTHIYLKRKTNAAGLPLPPNEDGTEQYEATFDTGGSLKVLNIKRRGHPEMLIPPIVRWRWLWEDETTWIRCLEGCCTTQ